MRTSSPPPSSPIGVPTPLSSAARSGQRVYKKLRVMKARSKLERKSTSSDTGSEDGSDQVVNNQSPTRTKMPPRRLSPTLMAIPRSSSPSESSRPTVAPSSKRQRTNGQPSVPDVELSLFVPLPVSQGVTAPQTPPRHRLQKQPSSGPHSSPRDLSALFAAVSPANSPHRGSQGGLTGSPSSSEKQRHRPMLTKAQSMGGIIPPSRSRQSGRADVIQDEEGSPFRVPRSVLGPSTPSRSLRPTQSMPEGPSSISMNTAGNEQTLHAPAPEAPQAERSGGANRTYGRSRTLLSAEGLGDGGWQSNGPAAPGYEVPAKESYANLRKRYEVDNNVDDGEGSGAGSQIAAFLSARPPQPISDMRSKGENRRFMDELGYLIDPITDPSSSNGLKRNSCIEMLNNMQDAEWLAKMRICGQTERLWEILLEARGDSDDIIDAACLLFVATLIRSGGGVENVLHSHNGACLRTVLQCLQVRDGALDQPSRVKAKGAAARLRHISRQLIPNDESSISTRRIASFIMAFICAAVQWATIEETIRVEKALLRVLRSYVWEIQRLSERFDLYEKGLDLFPTGYSVSLEHVEQCLRIISFLLLHSVQSRNALAIDHVDAEDDLLHGLIAAMLLSMKKDNGQQTRLAATCVIETLQILANICNVSDHWASRLASTPGALTVVSRIMLRTTSLHDTLCSPNDSLEDTQTSLFGFGPAGQEKEEPTPEDSVMAPEEIFCLVLAILAKSVVTSEMGPLELSNLKIDATCTGTGACLRNCRCPGAQFFGHHLVESYLEQLDHPDELQAGIMTGYLALLLVKLLGVSVSAAAAILPQLPGATRRQKLENLMTSLRELRGLESAVQRKLHDLGSSPQIAGEGADGTSDFGGTTDEGSIDGIGMLQETIDELKKLLAAD